MLLVAFVVLVVLVVMVDRSIMVREIRLILVIRDHKKKDRRTNAAILII